MAYRSRRDRRRATGGKTDPDACPAPEEKAASGGAVRKKRKSGGTVEGAAARQHLGRRARGGSAIEAWEAANFPDGVDKQAQSRPERGMPFGSPRKRGGRAEGGATDDRDDSMARASSGKDQPFGHDLMRYGSGPRPMQGAAPPQNENGPPMRASGGRTMLTSPPPGATWTDRMDRQATEPGDDKALSARTPDTRDWNEINDRSRLNRPAPDEEGANRGGHVPFRTRSGSVSTAARRETESKGEAMPGGRFPIRNDSDLANAKHAFGRANDKPSVRRWIDKRARELGEPSLGG